jgi:hypothetical protein
MRNCIYCNDPFEGRKDKKFCSDACRNAYNNDRYGIEDKTVRPIMDVLKRNRKTLMNFLSDGTVTVGELARNGYNFHYSTHQKRVGETVATFCFDVGFKLINGVNVEILKE